MSIIQFTCLSLGLLNGVFLAIMPKMNDPRPSLFRLFGFGTALAAALVFLAIAADQDHFLRTAALTMVLGLGGFFLTKALRTESPQIEEESWTEDEEWNARPDRQKHQSKQKAA